MWIWFRICGILSLLLLTGLACASASLPEPVAQDYAELRKDMVTFQLAARDIHNKRVLRAMGTVERHLFVPAENRRFSYSDTPLPIGLRQTISQPYIVALMTQLAAPEPTDRALEVGTGSGYQAAVLAEVVSQVYTIEIVPELANRSKTLLHELEYENIFARQGDGYAGWPEKAPFDIILVTAAAPRIPEPLLEQLAEGGRFVIPVGGEGEIQQLMIIRKQGGKISEKQILPVRFVPMTGEVRQR